MLTDMHGETTAIEDAFRSSPVAQAVVSANWELEQWNPRFEGMIGTSHRGDLLTTWFNANSKRDLDVLLRNSLGSETTQQHLRLPLAAENRSNDDVILTITSLKAAGDKPKFLVTLHLVDPAAALDASRRQLELERIVEQRTEALQRTNKELEMFSYSVSHDLRSPLRSVLGYSAALEEDFGDRLDAEGHDYLKRITAAAQRMDRLITAILAVSRISRAAVQRSDVNVSEIATSLVPEVLRSCPNASISVEPGILANADPALLRVVVANLLDNACKFSSKSPDPTIELGVAADLPHKPIFVRDNGIGFEEQYSEKIFEPFERLYTEEGFPGTGIGLYNVRRVVDRHEGKVWAVSEPGKGATFYFTLDQAAGG
jgi:signal transduction histidine kinase